MKPTPGVLRLFSLLALAIAVLLGTAQGAVDPDAAWTEGPVDEQTGIPYGDGRHMRVPVTVTVPGPMTLAEDVVAAIDLPLADVLIAAGHPDPAAIPGFGIDPDSFVVVEITSRGAPLDGGNRLVSEARLRDDGARHGAVVRWVMPGVANPDATPADEEHLDVARHFFIYFDVNYNGGRAAATFSDLAREPLLAAVAPGKGNQVYVETYDLPGAQGNLEPRSVRITSMSRLPVTLEIFEYDQRGRPAPKSTVRMGFGEPGQSAIYKLGAGGTLETEGAALLVADGPIVVEAISAEAHLDPLARAPLFQPSLDGGYLGTEFWITPETDETWYLFCPVATLPAGEPVCRARIALPAFRGQENVFSDISISPNHFVTRQFGANQPQVIDVEVGQLLVQRASELDPDGSTAGFVSWPAADGRAAGNTYFGVAGAADNLMLQAFGATNLRVQALTAGSPVLDSNLRLPGDGLFTSGAPWGTKWDRDWTQSDFPGSGPVTIRSNGESDGFQVASGPVSTQSAFGAIVALESPDGGYTYDFEIPALPGQTLGKITLFVPYGGTRVTTTLDGAAALEGTGTFQQHERLELKRAGHWHIEADAPVLATWTKRGTEPFMGNTGGATVMLPVDVGDASYSGYLLDVKGSDFVTAKPGQEVRFTLDITNLARSASGLGVADRAFFKVESSDLENVIVTPAVLDLTAFGPTRAGVVEVKAIIPGDVDIQTGSSTIDLLVSSDGNPDLEIRKPLTIRYETVRKVDVTADGVPVKVRREILSGGQASYNVTVTNRGTVADTYTMEFSQPPNDDWVVEVKPLFVTDDANRTPRLEPKGAAHYLVTVTPQPDGSAADLRTIVQATSSANSFVRGKVELRTLIDTDRSFRIEVDDPVRSVAPGDQTIFNITLHNEADVNEELTVTRVPGSTPDGWADPVVYWAGVANLADINHTVRIDPQSNITLEVHRAVPADAAPFQLGVDRFRLQSTFLDGTAGSDIELGTIVEAITGFNVTAEALSLPAKPGETTAVTLTLESTSNVRREIQVHPTRLPATQMWHMQVAGQEAPWLVDLAPGESTDLTVDFGVAGATPPGSVQVPLTFSTAGTPATVATLSFQVSERRAADVTPGAIALTAGHETALQVAVENTGNAPLDLEVTLIGLPDNRWTTAAGHVHLAAGANGTVQVPVRAPRGSEPQAYTVDLRVSHDGIALATVPWTLTVGTPGLDVTIERVVRLPAGVLNYQVSLANDGDAPLYDVAVELLSGDVVTERVELQELLASGTARASLLGGRSLDASTLRVSASHLEAPLVFALDNLVIEGDQEASGAPLTAALAALAAAALVTRHTRNRSCHTEGLR